MELRASTFQMEVDAIATSGEKPVHHLWQADIYIQKATTTAFKVFNIDFVRDYGNNYADQVVVSLMIPLSVYTTQIYPNKDNILITLYRQPLNESGEVAVGKQVSTQVYRALIIESNDPTMSAALTYPDNPNELDIGNPVTVSFQLVDRAAESIRLYSWGANVHQRTPGEALRAIFGLVSQQLKVDAESLITGVDMVVPDNQNVRKDIIFPDGVRLMDLPDYLQEKQGGIYNAGIDHYLQGGTWYVWPRYGLDRFNKAKRVLTIYNLPENALPGIERTYRETFGHVIIISTGASKDTDITEKLNLNEGNGVRFADGSKIMDGNITVQGGKVTARRGVGMNEYVDNKRRSGLNYAPMAKERISANPFLHASRLAAAKGIMQAVIWENADPLLLTPGMPVRFLYLKGGEVIERRGVLVKAHYSITPDNQTGIVFAQHDCTAGLELFLSKTPHDPSTA